MRNSACCRRASMLSWNRWRDVFFTMNLRILLLLVMLVFTSAGVDHASAQGEGTNAGAEPRQKIHYQISPQPLNRALRDFALTSGLQVSFPDDMALGHTSREVAGSYTPEEALSELLAGSGLSFRFTSVDTVTLERAQPSGMSQAPAGEDRHAAPAAGNTRSATFSSSVKPVVVPEIVVKDVHERNEPDQELVKDIAGTVNVVTREEIQ